MPFGITSAPEEFQRRVSNALAGLPGVTIVADDTLIYGKGDTMKEAREDHDNNLKQLLERSCQINLKLNLSKCRFHMTEIPFIGHVLTSEGVKPDPGKVLAMQQMEPPRNSAEVRRFFGHVNYLSKFLPNLSAEGEPLRRLINLPDDEFCWGEIKNKRSKS